MIRPEMTLGEFVKLKQALQNNMTAMIRDFERVTGATVISAQLGRFETNEIGHPSASALSMVELEVRLPV